jgi:hypothetical protein
VEALRNSDKPRDCGGASPIGAQGTKGDKGLKGAQGPVGPSDAYADTNEGPVNLPAPVDDRVATVSVPVAAEEVALAASALCRMDKGA